MIDLIFTHDSKESALRTRDTLHEYMKCSKAYVDSTIILSDGAPDCEAGEWIQTVKNKDGIEVEYKHCIALLIATDSEKVGDDLYQVIHVYDNEFDPKTGTLDLFLKS